MDSDSRHPASPGGGSPRSGFVPTVGLAAASAVLVFAILTLASSWIRAQRAGAHGSGHPAAPFAQEVDLWVGDLAPGVRGVLASEWNDPGADALYDATINEGLGLSEGHELAYYRLVVFNTTDKPVSLAFRDGQVLLTPKGKPPLPMKSLAALLSGGGKGAPPASSQAVVLRALGAGRETIDLPPGSGHTHHIAFERRVSLSEAASVASADGSAFRPRRMPGRQWAGILEAPSADDVKDL